MRWGSGAGVGTREAAGQSGADHQPNLIRVIHPCYARGTRASARFAQPTALPVREREQRDFRTEVDKLKFRCDRDDLSEALQTVQRGVSTRPGIPALTGVLLEVEPDTLTLTTTDLEVSARLVVPVQAQEQGVALIPARLLADMVKSLPQAPVELDADQSQARIQCGAFEGTVRLLPAEDFPSWQEPAATTVKLPAARFAESVGQVGRAASRDEARPDEADRDGQEDQDERPGPCSGEPLEERVIEHLRLSRPRRRPVVYAEGDGPEHGHGAGREPAECGRPRHACEHARRLQGTTTPLLHRASLAAAPGTGKALRAS